MTDFAPYLCTFRDCLRPQQTFLTSGNWIVHMQKHHMPVEWSCVAHMSSTSSDEQGEMVFHNEEKYKQHLREEHCSAKTITEAELDLHSRMNSRLASQVFTICPFCDGLPDNLEDKRGIQRALQKHIGEHLQSLALISLPWDFCELETAVSSNEAEGDQDMHRKRNLSGSSASEKTSLSGLVFPNRLTDPDLLSSSDLQSLVPQIPAPAASDDISVDTPSDPAWSKANLGSRVEEWSMMSNERPPYWKGLMPNVGLENDPNMAQFIERARDELFLQIEQRRQQTLRMTGLPRTTQAEDVKNFFNDRIKIKGRIIDSIGPISQDAVSKRMQTTVSFSSRDAANQALHLEFANRRLMAVNGGSEEITLDCDFNGITTFHTSVNPATGRPDIE